LTKIYYAKRNGKKMKLIIHRGTQEIGGSCVEIRTAKTRLLIDFGIPLVGDQAKLPDIQGLYKGQEKAIDGILISHSHLDHYGFLERVHPEIPVYMSQGASILIEVSNIFIPTKVGALNTRIIKHKKQFKIGDFTITPYLVDHSAFDALAFLIEGEGKRLFYSGDFRGHGRKAILFKKMLEKPPENIDCLVMEGSSIGRDDVRYKTEEDIQKRLEEILKERKNITFFFVSSQNIDRIVSAYKACLRTGSIFVIDIYTAFILDKLRKVSKGIPQFNWKNIRIKFLSSHAEALKNAGYRDLLYVYGKRKIDIREINRNKGRILMIGRDNSVFPLVIKELDDIEGAKVVYSMWKGYLTEKFEKYCGEKKLIIEMVHTSGHADPEDLKTFSNALKPRVLIPIHTFEAKRYPDLFQNVKLLKDGEMFLIN